MPKGSKVLMADDDKMLLDMYKERLELASYVVESCSNGEEALAHVRDFNPDIIMLDVMMPKMNGYETLASLKSDPTTKNIPVVMLSALMRDFNREKAVEGGAEDYLIKSEAMPSDVITKIEQVLQKYNQSSAVAQPVQSAPASTLAPNAQQVPVVPAQPVFEPATVAVASAPVAPIAPAVTQAPVVPLAAPLSNASITSPVITENPATVPQISNVVSSETPQAGGSV